MRPPLIRFLAAWSWRPYTRIMSLGWLGAVRVSGGYMVSRGVRWWLAGLVTAASFSVAAWVAGAFVLPTLMRSAADRWAVAAGLGVAMAAFVALWGKWWATREVRVAATEDTGEVLAGPGVSVSGKRSIAAGGDISGIASTGDGTTSTQHQ